MFCHITKPHRKYIQQTQRQILQPKALLQLWLFSLDRAVFSVPHIQLWAAELIFSTWGLPSGWDVDTDPHHLSEGDSSPPPLDLMVQRVHEACETELLGLEASGSYIKLGSAQG